MNIMKHVVCLAALAAGVSFSASAATYRVTSTAAGGGDGSWGSPLTLAEAVSAATADDDVILLASGAYTVSAAISLDRPLVIRGGLKGTDDTTLDETTPYSTIGMTAQNASIFNVTTDAAAKVNRFENLVLSGVYANNANANASAIRKGNAGSIEIVNCRILNNRFTNGKSAGLGVYLTGSADSTAVLSNCAFEGCGVTATSSYQGQAAYFSTFKEVTLDSCLFVTNGFLGAALTPGNDAYKVSGAALYLTGAPVKAKDCAFIANRTAWNYNDTASGGCVRLEGASGGSVFENCRWVGNSETIANIVGNGYAKDPGKCAGGGVLHVNLSSADATVAVKNCTIAYNCSDVTAAATGIMVRKGHLDLTGSIVADNFTGEYKATGRDVHVAAGSTATISNSLFSTCGADSLTATGDIDWKSLRFGEPQFVTPRADVAAGVVWQTCYYLWIPHFSLEALAAMPAVDVHQTPDSPGLGLGCYAGEEVAPAASAPSLTFGTAGAGGLANVIYVREGVYGSGRSWADPLPNIESAFTALTADRTEIWVSGRFVLTNNTYVGEPVASFAVRGGFAGTESSAAERPADGSRATIDGADKFTFLTVVNGEGVKVTLDRLSFEHCADGAVVKTGKGDIDFGGCRFLGCGFYDRGNNPGNMRAVHGLALNMSGSSTANAALRDCIIEGCPLNEKSKSVVGGVFQIGSFASMELSNCLFLTNGCSWATRGYGEGCYGCIAHFDGTPVTATRCRFIGNRALTCSSPNMGIFELTGASGGSVFDHCLFKANVMTALDASIGNYPKVGTLAISLSTSDAAVDIIGCTFAYNMTDTKWGAGGLAVYKGHANIKDSILYGNTHITKSNAAGGDDLSISSADGSADVSYSLFTAAPGGLNTSVYFVDSESYDADPETTLYASAGNDPQFVTPLATVQPYWSKASYGDRRWYAAADQAAVLGFDLHIKSPGGYWLNDGTLVKDAESPTSAALDAGDPTSDYSNEPSPNGGCVNMGFYGNSTNASMTAALTLSIDDVRTTYPTEWSRPHVEVDMGGSAGYVATVKVDCYTGGVPVVSRTFENVVKGDVVSWDPSVYLVAGDALEVRVSASAKGCDDAVAPADLTVVTGAIPPWSGKGGGEGIIHVRAGADGDATGRNWTDAFPTLEGVTNLYVVGNLPDAYREIWIAGRIERVGSMDKIQPQGPLVVRGGFTGVENSAAERPADSVSRIDGGLANDCLRINAGASAPISVERILFTQGSPIGFRKQGAGDLSVRNCRFVGNKRGGWHHSQLYDVGWGSGLGIDGGDASATQIAISNCVFCGNGFVGDSFAEKGAGVYISGAKSASIDDCLFVTNGVRWTLGIGNYGDNTESYGAALYAENAQVAARNCRFIANATQEKGGGAVRISGASGGSSFVNCLWSGNNDSWHNIYSKIEGDLTHSGALVVALSQSNQTVAVTNCTIAYNFGDRTLSAGGLLVEKGTAIIENSILFGNSGGFQLAAGVGCDLALSSADAHAVVRYSLLSGLDSCPASSVVPENLSTNAADGVVFADPKFVTGLDTVTNLIGDVGQASGYRHRGFKSGSLDAVMAFNLHLRGGLGYYDETTGGLVTDYKDAPDSPAIDAGDPKASRKNERRPHGPRVNMGAYGNTPWATISNEPGLMLFVR